MQQIWIELFCITLLTVCQDYVEFKIAHLLNIASVFSLHAYVHGYTELRLFTDMTCVLSVRLLRLIILWDLREHKSFLSRLSRQLDRSVFCGCLSVCMCELEVKRGIDKTYALNGLDTASSWPFY